jgi:glycine/D-amino acid oxidase-like deaminating enzyme
MRACIVGGGLAGSLLAWRLAGAAPGWRIDLVLGDRREADATSASGGAVRAYEPHPAQRRLAVDSMVELLASGTLRNWAGYREAGSIYLRQRPPAGDVTGDVTGELAEIEAALPGSVELATPAELADRGWADVHNGATGVLERRAGYTSPVRLRDAVLADGAVRRTVAAVAGTVSAVRPGAGSIGCTVAGARREYDLVVLAAGAWTGALLAAAGLPADGYRTKSIQYSVYPAGDWRPAPFVDEASGLYGRPTADGGLLLGLATGLWDVSPDRPPFTPELHEKAARLARARFPKLQIGPPAKQVGSIDCYCSDPVLALRPVLPAQHRLLTFSGGSGGSVKTALAASHQAAIQLIESGHTTDLTPVAPREGQL